MMLNIGPCFTAGFSLILIHLNENFRPTLGQCDVNMNQLYADCYKRNLTKVPNDLNKGIEIMNISLNLIENFTELDFAPYANLKELIMASLKPSQIPIKLFDPLSNLVTLDISYTFLGSPPAKLPPSIQSLYADGLSSQTNISAVDFTVLGNLERFSMSTNFLQNFPPIPETAPLVFIDLSFNPLSALTYSDIASYCLLLQINLDGVNIQLPDRACCGLKKWTDEYNISTDLKCEACSGSEQLSADAIEKYERCQNKLEFQSNLLSFFVQIGVVVIICICVCFVIFKYFRSRAKKSVKKDEKIEDAGEKIEDADEKSKDADEKIKDADEKIENADERIKDSDAEEEAGTEEV